MRNAAFEIARQSDAFAPTLAHQAGAYLVGPYLRLRDAWTLAKLRRTLDALDESQLADIGISRADIHATTGRLETTADAIARLTGDVRRCGWACMSR